MKFSYLAKTQDGTITKGDIEAAGQKAAQEALEKQSLTPISIRVDTKSQGMMSRINEKATLLPLKDKMLFARQLATLINAGVPISQALEIMKEQTENKKLKKAIAEVADDVEGGIQLSVAMAKHPKIFNTLFVNMIKAGEVGGTLDQSLERMASELEKEHALTAAIRGALIYPVAIIVLTIGVLIFMITYLIPQMAEIFKSFGGDMPAQITFLLNVSNFVRSFGIFLALAIIGGIYGFRKLLEKKEKVRYTWHQILMKLPIFGTVIKKTNISRFTRTLSSLLSSGVTVLEAMQVASDSLKNEVYKKAIDKSITKVKNGSTISEALKESKQFPVVVCQTIAVGEETGSTDKVLVKLTEYYEEEVTAFTKGISDLILPVMMILIGAVVGFMFYSIIVPLSNISNTISLFDKDFHTLHNLIRSLMA